MDRRNFLTAAAMASATTAVGTSGCAKSNVETRSLPIAINSGTLLRYNLPVERQIDLAAKTGYDGIELWVPQVEDFIKRGGKPEMISQQLKAANLKLFNLLGFAHWFDDDPKIAADSTEQLKREIELAAKLGSKFIAATGFGMSKIDPAKFGEYGAKYREMLDFGKKLGVVPLLELWGHRSWHKLEDLTAIAIASKSPDANFLLDFYHLYRGGNSFDSLNVINCARLPVFHINDYPATPSREKLVDADRVLPSDGVCDFNTTIPQLYDAGFRGAMSLEIFNKSLWVKYPPADLLKIGFEKTFETVSKSLA